MNTNTNTSFRDSKDTVLKGYLVSKRYEIVNCKAYLPKPRNEFCPEKAGND
jgi:hypothetical protein